MTVLSADLLRSECRHLRPVADPELDALRRAVLIEDVLGLRLSDDQIRALALDNHDSPLGAGAPPESD